jgi:hypothetical protein
MTMGTNIADSVRKLLEAAEPERRLRVNILLRWNLAPNEAQATINQIRWAAASTSMDVMERSKSVTVTLPLREVARIAAMPNVLWIDLDHEAAREAILDS